MKIYIEREGTTKVLRFNGSVRTLLQKLKINPVSVIVVRDAMLITLDTQVNTTDTLEIKSVISGG